VFPAEDRYHSFMEQRDVSGRGVEAKALAKQPAAHVNFDNGQRTCWVLFFVSEDLGSFVFQTDSFLAPD